MKNRVVLKVPKSFSPEKTRELERSVQSSLNEGRVVVIPEGAEIYSLPVVD